VPSELQRVARGLVDCFDEIPRVVDQLVRTAARCRENAQVALIASRGQATVAAQQLDAAAHACEAAAHYLSMAPPKARGWAEALTGPTGKSTNRPSSDSADRNRFTSAPEIRTRRQVVTYADVEVADDNEPPLITVARKAFEEYRKAHEKDDEEDAPPEPLELEITVTETGELLIEKRDEKQDDERSKRLAAAFLEPDKALTEAVKNLLASFPEPEDRQPLTLKITADQLEVIPADNHPHFTPITVDIQVPGMRRPSSTRDFDPALELRPLGSDFAPGVHDPRHRFLPKENVIAERLEREGWRIDARPEDHASGQKNPDAVLRRSADDEGAIVEFKTQDVNTSNALKRSMLLASRQARQAAEALEGRHEVVIDGRTAKISEKTALRSFRRALGQPGSTVLSVVHVILGDGRLVTFTKEQ
jgi:hypothetical protein